MRFKHGQRQCTAAREYWQQKAALHGICLLFSVIYEASGNILLTIDNIFRLSMHAKIHILNSLAREN